MLVKHSARLKEVSQKLRKNMTKEEKHLWYDFFKKTNYSVKRQHVIEDYIADFYIPEIKLAIELDGSQHYEPQAMILDQIRTENIAELGIEIIRFPNNVVNNKFNELCEYLDFYIQEKIQNNL